MCLWEEGLDAEPGEGAAQGSELGMSQGSEEPQRWGARCLGLGPDSREQSFQRVCSRYGCLPVGTEGQRGAGAGEALGAGVGSRPGSHPHLSGPQRPTQLGPEEMGMWLGWGPGLSAYPFAQAGSLVS